MLSGPPSPCPEQPPCWARAPQTGCSLREPTAAPRHICATFFLLGDCLAHGEGRLELAEGLCPLWPHLLRWEHPHPPSTP